MVWLDSGALAELEKQMPWFDLPLEQLREYRTETVESSELDWWWQRRLDEARAQVRPPADGQTPVGGLSRYNCRKCPVGRVLRD
jgi:hypothetical protein